MNLKLVKSSWLTVPKNEVLQCSYSNNDSNTINIIVSLAVHQWVYVFSCSCCSLSLIKSKQSTDKRRILSLPFADKELLNRQNETASLVLQKKSVEKAGIEPVSWFGIQLGLIQVAKPSWYPETLFRQLSACFSYTASAGLTYGEVACCTDAKYSSCNQR